MNEMRNVGTIAVNEVIFGKGLYQRQTEIFSDNSGKPTWFVSDGTWDAWQWVGREEQARLESVWQALHSPVVVKPVPWTDEDRQDALCEQMASDDYEASVY